MIQAVAPAPFARALLRALVFAVASSAAILASGCGDDPAPSADTGTPTDTGGDPDAADVARDSAADLGDGSDAADVPGEVAADPDADGGSEDAADSGLPDAADSDAAPDAEPDFTREPDAAIDAAPLPDDCGEPFETELPQGRWSLSMFHYNVQYVAGGTEGFAEIALGSPALAAQIDVDEAGIEDLIIAESLAPVVALLERNPDFALTFEMQGYMIDVIAARFPRLLERMRALIDEGRLEIASIHWSDQFFLAFGREDMDRSWAMTQASFEAADIPLSRVVFTQEGQFGEGFAEWLRENRPDAVMVMARNLQGFYQRDLADQPLFDLDGLRVILPRSSGNDDIYKEFNFFDDGELLATGDLNPYVGRAFVRNLGAIRGYEEELRCATHRGIRVGLISDYVDALAETDFEPPAMPPFLDGTWQPGSTRGPLRWMGGAGGLSPEHEADNDVLTACVAARHQVLALQTLTEDGPRAELSEALDEAWRELLWGEVSDARGVNPWWGEVQYGLEHCGNAHAVAAAALEAERVRRGEERLVIDTREGTVTTGPAPADPLEGTEVLETGPIAVGTSSSAVRAIETTWRRAVGASDDDPWILDIVFRPNEFGVERYATCMEGRDDSERWDCFGDPRAISVTVPRTPGLMGYRPALSERIVRYTEDDFVLSPDATNDAAWTTAADGLIVLGDTSFFVKDVTRNHLAVGFPATVNNDRLFLRDETVQLHREVHWRFWYTTSEETAIELAERNLNPIVVVEAADE
jgi:hypothetical protein